MRHARLAIAAAMLAAGGALFAAEPAVDTLHGVAVADPFRHLEDPADPRTQAFFREQDERARSVLDAIAGRAALLEAIREASRPTASITRMRVRAGRYFYLRLAPGAARPVLCMRDGLSGPERILVDPERFAIDGRRTAIQWFAPAPDARHVAYGIARGEDETLLRVVETAGARDLPIEIDRTRFNADMAWHADGRSFYYARVPEGNTGARRDANIRVYRHVLGRDTARDEIVFAAGALGALDVPEISFPGLVVPLESRHAYAVVRQAGRNEIAVYVTDLRSLAAGAPRWRRIASPEDQVTAIEAWREDLYLVSHRRAPHSRVLGLKADRPELARAKVVVPEGDVFLRSIALARDALYLRTALGGIDRLERVPIGLLGARRPQFVKTPFDTAITELVTDPRRPGAFLRLEGALDPPVIVEVDARTQDLRDTKLQPHAAAEFSAVDEVRLYATARDGTKIPVTLVYRKTTQLTGDNPTILVGHGSHGLSLRPGFDPARLAWLERGGVIAFAHLRGGGEYGPAWHAAARGRAKATAIEDFIAVADFIVQYGFTNPKRLAIAGTGAGGIPVGGALVRRPELFAAAVARAPLMDLVRFERSAAGAGQRAEFGSVATREGFEGLLAISAYHHVREGAAYPAVLLTAGLRDTEVEPWQAGKMAARLQAAGDGARPVLLRVETPSVHSAVATRAEREEEWADIFSFLLWQFGDPAFQPPPPPSPPPPSTAPAPASTARAGAELQVQENPTKKSRKVIGLMLFG